MKKKFIAGFMLVLVLVALGALVRAAYASTFTWTDPGGSGLQITFTTPNNYGSCASPGDRIYTTGIPGNWNLQGFVNVIVVQSDGSAQIVASYNIDQSGDLDLTISYPPAWTWPYIPPPADTRELHVDLGIVVRDENAQIVPWVGGDPNLPGVLGPRQDWDVSCREKGTPDLGITKYTNGADANDPNGADVPSLATGDPVSWAYHVTNTGNWPIHKSYINVSDNQPGVDPVFNQEIVGDGDDVLEPGEVWEYVATGTALDLSAPPQEVFVQEGACTYDGTEPPRTAYVNIGTVSIPGLSVSDPSSYCNSPVLSLGDRVWYDQNQNGIQDANEPGYNGVTVDLYDNATCTGSPIASTTTMAGPAGFGDGYYQFTDLPTGDYCVQFGNIPAGWNISPPDQGDGTNDSSTNASAQIPNIHLTADDPDEDMGVYVPGSLGDSVVCVSTGEGLANITVTLFEDFNGDGVADGPAIATTETDSTGFYQFTGLEVALAGDPNNLTQYIVQVDVNDPDLGTCNVPIPPTEYNPPLDSDNPNNPDNDFKFEEQLACDLAVSKSCLVTPAPTADLFCSDHIVATTLRYTGPSLSGATVEIDPDKSPTAVYSGVDLISGETVLTLPAENGFSIDARPDENELGARTKIRINGIEEVIHTSCSTPYVAGQPAPLDNPKGNPSPLWFVENFVDKDSPEIVAPPVPPQPSNSCDVTLGPAPSCATLGKPTSLTFRYTGGGCAASNNTQDPSKATCSGSIDPSLAANITTSNSGYMIVPSTVNSGEEFTVSASSFNADSFLTLSNAGGSEALKIHTSCSQPLEAGDVFGSLTLVAFNGERAGAEVTYLYEVTNLGDPLTNVTLTDDPLGPIDTGGPFSLASGETRLFEMTTQVLETITNKGTFSGNLANDVACSASDFATVTVVEPEEPCAICKGGTTELTLIYQGINPAQVVVYDDPSVKLDKILFQGLVNPGEQFTITPRPGQDKLNKDISIYVDGAFNAKVHTSCSQPIGPGLIAGDFRILDGRSKDNGPMCPLDTCSPKADAAFEFNGREIKWNIANLGDLGLEIASISIQWPQANGYLDEVKRDGDVIHKGDFPPPSAVIDSGWEGNSDKRTIKPGETDTLKFKFQNDATLDGEYHILADFTSGCSVEVTYSPPFSGANFTCSKPIDSLTMIWNGSDPNVWVTAWKGNVGSTAVTNLAPVSVGNKLTVSGFSGSPNDVYWEIFSDAAGTAKLGESTFHLSCSDVDMNDALDCGKPEGDGKGQSGYLNDWLLDGIVDSDQTLQCTP